MLKRALVIGAAAAVLAGISASVADAKASGAFLCYSQWQVNPGFWSFTPGRRGIEANGLFAQGYWSPYAEKSIPTATKIAGGWYLLCNLQPPAILPTTLQPVSNLYQNLKGSTVKLSDPSVFPGGKPKAGYYQQAQ